MKGYDSTIRDYNFTTTSGTMPYPFETADTNTITLTYDHLIDWLPNSCLYTKYIPAWHIVESYKKHPRNVMEKIWDNPYDDKWDEV